MLGPRTALRRQDAGRDRRCGRSEVRGSAADQIRGQEARGRSSLARRGRPCWPIGIAPAPGVDAHALRDGLASGGSDPGHISPSLSLSLCAAPPPSKTCTARRGSVTRGLSFRENPPRCTCSTPLAPSGGSWMTFWGRYPRCTWVQSPGPCARARACSCTPDNVENLCSENRRNHRAM